MPLRDGITPTMKEINAVAKTRGYRAREMKIRTAGGEVWAIRYEDAGPCRILTRSEVRQSVLAALRAIQPLPEAKPAPTSVGAT